MLFALAAFACGSEAGSLEPPAAAITTRPTAPVTPGPPNALPSEGEPALLGAPYPVVLMHGMAGFVQLELGPIGFTYFDGVVEDLTKRGESVFVTLVPPFDTSAARAEAESKQIDAILKKTGKAKVNLVGHSQGGIDARLLASPQGLGYGDRIASVTTVATPHRGSKIADAALGLLRGVPPDVIDRVTGGLLSLVQRTAYDLANDPHLRAQIIELSEKHMTTVFNPKYQDAPGVVYMSYAGRTNLRTGLGICDDGAFANRPFDVDVAQLSLEPLAIFLEEGQLKVNDGVVSVQSAKWGAFQQCVPADHLKEVGQIGPAAAGFDHLKLFRDIVARVRQAGL